MAATTTTDREVTMSETRTYETFSIQFDGSNWSGYDSAAEAQSVIDFGSRPGVVVRKTWTVEVDPRFAHLYQPGI